MTETDLFAFYGSLRMGMSNYDHYAAEMTYMRTATISGYRLYSLGDYPYAVKCDNSNEKLVVEIFKSTDENVRKRIHELETEAGYYFDVINIDGDRVGIYLFRVAGNDTWVKSGNWVEFFRLENK